MERFNSGLLLTSSQVAELLGVHVSSVKRWTNEGELSSLATSGGHRRIHLDDALATARARGIQTYLDPFSPFEGHVWRAVREVEDSGDYRRVLSLAVGWLMREYPQRVGDLFVELGSREGVPFDQFLDRGVRALLVRVDEGVREGRIRGSSGHLVSQLLTEALFRIRLGVPNRRRPRGTERDPVAIVASLEGELHDPGVLGVRLLLERERYAVHYLGPQVPPAEIAGAQQAQRGSLVCVVSASPREGGRITDGIRVLASHYDPRAPYALAISAPAPIHGITNSSSPFEELVIPPDTEALRTWIRRRREVDRQGQRASA